MQILVLVATVVLAMGAALASAAALLHLLFLLITKLR